MSNFDIEQIQPKMDEIVRDYIYLLLRSRNVRQNYFSNAPTPDDQASFYHSQGFQVLYKDLANKYIVKEEALLEGYTRAFLINPIIDYLLGCQGVKHEWHYGSTFSDPYISNRVYELDAYVEFIFEYQGKTIGCRYTSDSYPEEMTVTLDRNFNFLYRNAEIPGFEQLKIVDELWVVDWSGISAEALAATNKRIPGLIYRCRNITAKDFFDTLFGEGVFRIFRETASNAIKDATDIIALKAVPQLLPNNMMTFKDLISAGFSEEETNRFSYIFQEPGTRGNLPAGDLTTIQTMFHENGCGAAIAGDADFAKSFITSEYLFQILKEGLGIDYTAVIVGYLKSVEQLLFLYYISAFDGKNKLRYWDECKPPMKFDPSDPSQYRYAPYNKRKKQAFYCHAKCTDSAPDFGHLSYFLRDNDFLWKVSNQGVEYIYNCLDDFRKSCRNSHFHKDNIPYTEYKEVKRIRNNAKVCIFYLLGGFNLLDSSQSAEKQLGVVDDSFDRFYKTVRQEGCRLFWVENVDRYTGLIYYLNQDAPATYSESGRIRDAKLKFVKLPSADRNGVFVDEIQSLCQSKEYTDNNMMVITRETMPTLIVPERVRRKPCGSSGSNSGNSSSDNDSGDTSADTQTTQIDYPNKDITLIVPYAAGGTTDLLARALSTQLGQDLGVNVVVQNVEGGGGTTGTSQAVNSAADGYTLAICSNGGYLINPVINEVGYTWETTTPIAIVSEIPIAIGVAGSSSYQTLDELLAAAGDSSLTYSTPGANSTPHLLSAAVAMQAGVSWNHSPNSSSPAAIAELLGGHIDAVCVNLPTFKSYTPNGDVRLLAVTGEERDSNYPDVPTFKELGYDFDASVYFCIAAPDGGWTLRSSRSYLSISARFPD